MNLIAIIGNVSSEPELRYTAKKTPICTFRIAVSRPGGEEVDFFDVVTVDRQAEVCAEYLQVGRRIGIEGRLKQSSWSTDSGNRSRIEVVATRVSLLGSPAARTGA